MIFLFSLIFHKNNAQNDVKKYESSGSAVQLQIKYTFMTFLIDLTHKFQLLFAAIFFRFLSANSDANWFQSRETV